MPLGVAAKIAQTAMGFGIGFFTLALAFQPVLSDQDVQKAAQEGIQMVTPRNGYILGNYLFKQFHDGIRLQKGEQEVDDIVVSTPYERVRYNGFIYAFQQKPFPLDTAKKIASELKNKITFSIYTHSTYSVDEELADYLKVYQDKAKAQGSDANTDPNKQPSYLIAYSLATLEVGGKVYPAQKTYDGPFRDQFTIEGGKAEIHFLGVVHYTFDLRDLVNNGKIEGQGVLRFSDSQGKEYSETVDLGSYY
ncbi:MAG: hypothetical protein IVW51_03985 [Thermaceae bacterium]|nr:hypothetical protein [Thermaceae bacterium]